MTLKCSEFINVLCVCAFQMYRVNCVNHRGKLWIATCWIAHVCVHAQVHDHTDQNKALVACFTGESISIFIDQNSGYYFALTWKSISQLGCTASLDFYDWSRDKDTIKVYSDPTISVSFIWHEHFWGREKPKYCCHMLLILERFGLWGHFSQEGTHYKAEGVKSIAAILH